MPQEVAPFFPDIILIFKSGHVPMSQEYAVVLVMLERRVLSCELVQTQIALCVANQHSRDGLVGVCALA